MSIANRRTSKHRRHVQEVALGVGFRYKLTRNAMTILEDALAGIRHRDLLSCNTPAASLQYQDKSAAAIQCHATQLMKRPRRSPGCLIVCRVARRTLQSFILCARLVGHAANLLQTRKSVGPRRPCLNGWRGWRCVHCSTRHRRVGDRGPGHAGRDPAPSGHSLSAYIDPVSPCPVIFTPSR